MTAGKCWQHLASEDGLRVKPSTIPGAGKGLFADRDFAPNRKIADYARKSKYMPGPIDPSSTEDRYPYAWCPTERRCYNASSTQSTVARYANGCDKPEHRKPCNAVMKPSKWLVSTRRIAKGDEIFFPYGPDYWNS